MQKVSIDKEFLLVYFGWVFKKVCYVLTAVGLVVVAVVGILGETRSAIYVLMGTAVVLVVGRVR